MLSKLQKAFSQLPYLPRALGLVWDAAPRLTLVWAVLLAVQGLLPAATVYLTRALVNSLVAVAGAGAEWARLRPALLLAALMAAILLLSEILRSIINWVRTAQSELVQDHISNLVHRKSIQVDLAFYDLPDYFDHLHRARSDAGHRPVALLENMGSVLQNGITLVAMAGVLLPYGWWLPLALLLSTLPALYVVLDYTLRQHQWRVQTTADQRRTWYYDWLLTARETASELRLFDLGNHFSSAYQNLRQRLRSERIALAKDQGVAETLAGGSALLVTAGALAWMGWRVLQGHGTLGDLALFYQAFSQGQRLMRSLLENVGQIYSNSLFLGDLFEFLALQPQISNPASPLQPPETVASGARGPGIAFHNVSFRYPGSSRTIIKDFNLNVAPGEVAAIVGTNGAGKSTLIKLLCRFYEPEQGSVQLAGIDLRQLDLKELRRLVTVLFQVPVQYSATVRESILLGDLRAAPVGAQTAAWNAGAHDMIDGLPQGYDTQLGIWFSGGLDLSVGEWQRIALARAYLREAPVIVLDEPTSAMDPWAEMVWLKRFRQLARDRTALIITHRFTTAMHADVIHVMDRGQILESGSHEQLLEKDGVYAQSWKAQMRGRGDAANDRMPDVAARAVGRK
ncbi:MAG: ABC transporter ATP-binding protein [Desulfoferrobacter sp.]